MKEVDGILNHHLTTLIWFHDTLHVFHTGRITGTASLEARMLQNIMAMTEEVLFEIFFDLHTAYDALDCKLYLKILSVHGVGPRSLRLLYCYWGQLAMVARIRRYFVTSFKGYHGVTYGGGCYLPQSPSWLQMRLYDTGSP